MSECKKTGKFQQGDVLLRKVETIPEDVEMVANGILAEGEATGHMHAIGNPVHATLFKGSEGDLFVDVKGDKASITHQEHGVIELPKGKYKLGIVREVDPFTEEIHKVRD